MMGSSLAAQAGATVSAPPRLAPIYPGSSRLLGSAPDLRRDRIGTYERAMREHGDVVRFVVGPPGRRFEVYGVFHPDGVHRVLAGPRGNYSKATRVYQEITAAIGLGLLTSEGALWERQRRLIQPLFTRRAIAGYATLMADEASAAADRWRGATTIDAHAEMTRLTLRVVGRAIFGDDVDDAREVLRSAFPVATQHAIRRSVAPVALPASWPTRVNRRAGRARRALYSVVDNLVARRKATGAAGDDLLSRLLRARDEDTGAAMDEQQVRDEALIFLLAGHETTSVALTFALDLLAHHPEEQARVRDELDRVLGDRPPTVDDVSALQRVTMVLDEAMRLYPPAPGWGRRAEVDDEIGGMRIPRGAIVLATPWATHRHPAFWERPEAFDPSRFGPEHAEGRHRFAYFPFGAGPRACIGSHFALMEAAIALAIVLQRYRLTAEAPPPALDATGITLRPAQPVAVAITPR